MVVRDNLRKRIQKQRVGLTLLILALFSFSSLFFMAPPVTGALASSSTPVSRTGFSAPLTTFAAPGDPSGDQGTTDTCIYSGNPASWFICPIYDGMGSLSDFLLKYVSGFLKTNPIPLNTSEPVYKIWSNFRIYGNILLVIALIVAVFGQSIGGGLLDAYTVKKMLPRILLAAILINVSIYIVAFLVDVTNVLGGGIGAIINGPIDQYNVNVGPSGWKLGILATGTGIAAGGSIVAFLASSTTTLATIGGFLPYLLLFIILPALISIIFIFAIIIFRQAIIMALVLVAPVAFALYVLPNTEQYFKKWWGLLWNMLLLYPVIIAMFAIANLLAYTTLMANGTDSFFGYFIAFLLQFLPLFMIPFAFRLAGGVLGRLSTVATSFGSKGLEAAKGNQNDPWSRRNRARRSAGDAALTAREGLVNSGNKAFTNNASRKGLRGSLYRGAGTALSKTAGMGNFEELRSRRNAEGADMLKAQASTGGDATIRALFATKGQDGVYRGTNGAEYSQYEVDKARNLYGQDPSLYQSALVYEMGKSSNDTELQRTLAKHGENMNDRGLEARHGAGGIWAGAKYSLQGTRRELKHTSAPSAANGGSGTRKARAFTQEVAETVGNYPLSNMRTSTVKSLRDDYRDAGYAHYLATGETLQGVRTDTDEFRSFQQQFTDNNGGVDRNRLQSYMSARDLSGVDEHTGVAKTIQVRRNVESTAETFDMRYRTSGSYARAGDGDDAEPLSSAQTGAAGRVNQEIQSLVSDTAAARQQAQPNNGGGRPTQQPRRQQAAPQQQTPQQPTQPLPQPQQPEQPRIIRPGDPGFNLPPSQQPRPPRNPNDRT